MSLFFTAQICWMRAHVRETQSMSVPCSTISSLTSDERDAALLIAYRAQDQLNRSVLEGARAFVEQAASGLDDVSGGVARFSFGPGASRTGQGIDLAGSGLIQSSGDEQLQVIEEASNQHTLAHVRLLEGDAAGAEQAINTALDLIALVPRAAAAHVPSFHTLSLSSTRRAAAPPPADAMAACVCTIAYSDVALP